MSNTTVRVFNILLSRRDEVEFDARDVKDVCPDCTKSLGHWYTHSGLDNPSSP